MELIKYLIKKDRSINDVIQVINNNQSGIALVVDDDHKLLGTVTDGDIRRYLLSGKSLTATCSEVMWTTPTTSRSNKKADHLKIMEEKHLHHLPVLDEAGVVTSLAIYRELVKDQNRMNTVVIMAGGEGKRLLPLTKTIPKPMVEVRGKPILESIVTNLAAQGLTQIYITVNYLSHVIQDYFEDGKKWNVEIQYVKEEKKLGTAGALSLLSQRPTSPFVVMNGDVLSNINFTRLLEFHTQHRSAMTVAAAEYNFNIPYGVLELAGHYVMGVSEKPTKRFLCNAGIYVLDPEVLDIVPLNEEYNMTQLLEDTARSGLPIAAFPINEYWIDIGQKKDLLQAQQEGSDLFSVRPG